MEHNELIQLAGLVGLAVGAQVLARRLAVPSILLLIIAGFIVGPVTGWIDPNELLGDLLLPLVSLAVAVILFEGGLTLDLRELRDGVTEVVARLLTIGLLITWALGALFAYLLFDMSGQLAILLGAVLVVSGPTVILPILRQIRLGGRVESVLRWEGIAIDPIGVLLAVLVFEAVVAGQRPTLSEAVLEFSMTVGAGTLVGLVASAILVWIIRHGHLEDQLEEIVALAMVIVAFAVADLLASESGLLSAVLMGMVLANWRGEDLRHIHGFKESIGLLLIGLLFVVLTARVPQEALGDLGLAGLAYLLILIIVVRPLAVWASTIGSGLNWRERVLLGAMAPRGIVAAASVSIFAVALAESQELPGADDLVPIAFLVIIGTVAVTSFLARPLAKALDLVASGPPKVMIVGAHRIGRRLAIELRRHDIPVEVWATDPEQAEYAVSAGIEVRTDDLLSEERDLDVAFEEIETALILTENDEFNGLVAERLREAVEPDRIFQIAAPNPSRVMAIRAFDAIATLERLDAWLDRGARVESIKVAEDDDYAAGDDVPMLVIAPGSNVKVVTDRSNLSPAVGNVVVSLTGATVSDDPAPAEIDDGNGPRRMPGARGRSKLRRLRQLSDRGRGRRR